VFYVVNAQTAATIRGCSFSIGNEGTFLVSEEIGSIQYFNYPKGGLRRQKDPSHYGLTKSRPHTTAQCAVVLHDRNQSSGGYW